MRRKLKKLFKSLKKKRSVKEWKLFINSIYTKIFHPIDIDLISHTPILCADARYQRANIVWLALSARLTPVKSTHDEKANSHTRSCTETQSTNQCPDWGQLGSFWMVCGCFRTRPEPSHRRARSGARRVLAPRHRALGSLRPAALAAAPPLAP
jgi:hypothetical protein